MELQRRARDVLLRGHADEIAEMAQFHAQSSIACSYAEARNMVFPDSAIHVAESCHDENTKSKRTRACRTRLAGHVSHFQLRGLLRPAMDGLPQLARHQR